MLWDTLYVRQYSSQIRFRKPADMHRINTVLWQNFICNFTRIKSRICQFFEPYFWTVFANFWQFWCVRIRFRKPADFHRINTVFWQNFICNFTKSRICRFLNLIFELCELYLPILCEGKLRWTVQFTNKVQKTSRYSSNKYSSQIKPRVCRFLNLIYEQFTNKVQKSANIHRVNTFHN